MSLMNTSLQASKEIDKIESAVDKDIEKLNQTILLQIMAQVLKTPPEFLKNNVEEHERFYNLYMAIKPKSEKR